MVTEVPYAVRSLVKIKRQLRFIAWFFHLQLLSTSLYEKRGHQKKLGEIIKAALGSENPAFSLHIRTMPPLLSLFSCSNYAIFRDCLFLPLSCVACFRIKSQ